MAVTIVVISHRQQTITIEMLVSILTAVAMMITVVIVVALVV